MINLLFCLLLIFVAGYYLALNIGFIRDETKLSNYMASSPKARFWVDKYGMEKASKLMKRVFGPIGIAWSLVLSVIGVLSLLAYIQ